MRVLQGRRFGWELGTQLASNGNRILDMGGIQSLTIPNGGGQAQHRVGFSIADMFLYKVVSAKIDASGAVLEALCDGGTGRAGLEMGGAPVPCAQAPRVLWGHTQPTWQAGVNSAVTLFSNLRLYARVDGNGGHVQSNTEIRALHNQGSTLAVIRRDDPFLQVYRAIEADAVGTYQAGFLRLRELSASYTLPPRLAGREGMCELAFDNGPRVTRAEAMRTAEQRFTAAIALAAAAGDASLRNMATVGRARARLDLGDLPGAAADAALVPSGFVRAAEYSESQVPRENRLYNLTVRNDFLSVGPDYRGLTLPNGQADPRVRVTNTGRVGSDNVTPVWQQQKFTGSGAVAPPIASYAEAQLILAEASGGQAAVEAINRVRALSNVPALAGPPPADVTALVLEERRRQLFSEGQRYADMLRKNLPFPTGANRKGQTYSGLTCVPLPDVETRNNPNLGA